MFAGIDSQDHRFNGLSVFHHVAGLSNFAFGPGHFRDVNQTFDAGLKFDEGTEVHQLRDGAAHAVSEFVLLGPGVPGMRLELLHS